MVVIVMLMPNESSGIDATAMAGAAGTATCTGGYRVAPRERAVAISGSTPGSSDSAIWTGPGSEGTRSANEPRTFLAGTLGGVAVGLAATSVGVSRGAAGCSTLLLRVGSC